MVWEIKLSQLNKPCCHAMSIYRGKIILYYIEGPWGKSHSFICFNETNIWQLLNSVMTPRWSWDTLPWEVEGPLNFLSVLSPVKYPHPRHYLLSLSVTFQFSISKPPCVISYRNIKEINLDSLSSWITILTPLPLPTILSKGTMMVSRIFSSHLLRTSLALSAIWFTPDLCSMKSKNRTLKRLYRKTSLTIHKDRHTAQWTLYKNSVSQTKKSVLLWIYLFQCRHLWYLYTHWPQIVKK